MLDQLYEEWNDAQRRAWDALARYKFWMFGYHAARVIYVGSLIARMGGPRLANPFGSLVAAARAEYCILCGDMKSRTLPHLCTSESLGWTGIGQAAFLLGDGAELARAGTPGGDE